VQAAQIDVGGDRAHLEDFQKLFALGLDDDLRQQKEKRLVLRGGFPAVLVSSLLGIGQRLDGVLPGARRDASVAASEIGFSDLEIEHRLALSLVLRFDDLLRCILIRGAKTGALTGLGVHAVKCSTANAPTN